MAPSDVHSLCSHPALGQAVSGVACTQELEHLNLAVNNITRVQNLQGCESLARLDLTLNFLPAAALPTLASLRGLAHLRDLTLTGNPCTAWPGYRPLVL